MSTTQTNQDRLCREVEERMTEVLDGTAPGELTDHVADCDACRDTRYEAERAAALVAHAGADFRADAGFADRVLARIDVDKLSASSSATATAPTSITASKPAPSTKAEDRSASSRRWLKGLRPSRRGMTRSRRKRAHRAR